MHRVRPESVASFGLAEQITALTTELNQLTEAIAQSDGHYITPDEVEAVAYSVKRPVGVMQTSEGSVQQYNVYWYNKLMSQTAIFAPVENDRPVKVMHLSKPDDPRNIEGRQGVERRNQLTQIATQLWIAESAILRARGYANAKARSLAAAQSSEGE